MSSTTSELIRHKQFIRAGAGAGKTTRLISTFYSFSHEFKKRNGRWPKVVLSTFTKKATQEIKERLLKLAIEKNDAEFVSYLGKSSLVQISTIHLLLQNILFRFHDRIGFINQIQIIEDSEELTQIFRLVKNEFALSADFIELIEHFKMVDLAVHIRDCIRLKKEFSNLQPVPSSELEALTQKSMSDLASGWAEWLSGMSEYTGGLNTDWQRYIELCAQFNNFLKQGDLKTLSKWIDEMPKKPSFTKKKPPFPEILNEKLEVLREDSDQIVTFTNSTEFREMHQLNHDLFQALLEKVFLKWQAQQKTSGQITIADLELLSLQIATEYPDDVAEFAKEIDFIMLDEYQDTSPLQVKILQLIVEQTNVFIVGDPQQSIYLFRGARTEVFLNQESYSKKNNFEMTSLQTNYRSHPDLLQFFNDYFGEHGTKFVSMQPGPIKKSTYTGERIFFTETPDQLQSAVLHLLSLHQNGVDYNDMAILSKKNDELLALNSMLKAKGIPVDLLTAAGMERKREILDCTSFLKFIVNPYDDENLVKLLRSPWFFIDDENLYLIRKVQKEKKYPSLWVALKNLNGIIFNQLLKYLDFYLEKGFLYAFEQFLFEEKLIQFSYSLDDSGRLESNLFKFYQILYEKSLSPNFDLNQFVSQKSFLGVSLESDGKSESQPASPKPAVKLMTIHGSKGLQFKHVVVIGMNDIITPKTHLPLAFDSKSSKYALALTNPHDGKLCSHDWAVDLRNQLNERLSDESYRLLYVAMTRAEDSICLIAEDLKKNDKRNWKSLFFWPMVSSEVIQVYKNNRISVQRHTDLDQEFKKANQKVQTSINSIGPFDRLKSELQSPVQAFSVTDLLNMGLTKLSDLNKNKTLSKEKRISAFKVSDHVIAAQTKALVGTRAHTLFESIKFNNFLADSQSANFLSPEEMTAINYLKNLKDIPFKEIMSNGFVEFGFKLKLANSTVQGQIDAWGKVDRTIYLIDYKTGDQKYLEKAFLQLDIYAQCLLQMNQILKSDNIVLAAIFPFDEKIAVKKMDFSII